MDSLYLPQDGLNIDRASLPQVASVDIPDYLAWLKEYKNISSLYTETPIASLRPSQGNFNTEKIKDLMTQERERLRQPVIVSADHYLADGHHRWIALLNLDRADTIPAILMSAKILDLIAATREYPKSFTKSVVESFRSITEAHNNEKYEEETSRIAENKKKPENTKAHKFQKAEWTHPNGHPRCLRCGNEESVSGMCHPTLTEAAEKHAVLAYGRMNPPTAGHAKLVDKVHEVAKQHSAHHEVVLSHSQDSKSNPLSQADKIKHAKRAFPGANITPATKAEPTIFHHAAKLHKAGYQHLHVIAGADRAKEFNEHLHKYNGRFDREGRGYKFKSIQVHSAGARDESAKGIEGVSASKMREHAHSGNFKEFSKGVSSHMKPEHAKELYHDVRKGQGHLHEALEILAEGVHDHGIFKAVFLAGAPGSGKDFVLKKSLDGHGLTEINSDTALEHLTAKHTPGVKAKAKSLTDLRQRLAVQGRNGLIINSTGAKVDQIKKIKKELEDLGYDTKMVFVDASDNVSRNRNVERGQKGGRMIPEKLRAEKWRQAQDSRVELSKLFGGEHYHEFSNDEDLRHNTDPEVSAQKTKELDDIHKTVRKFTQAPPVSPIAHEWIHTNLGKLAKQPIGNKRQQAAIVPSSQESQATEEANKLGLSYYGFGRYGKNGRVTHFSLHGRLVEKKKALIPPKTLQAPVTKPQPAKSLNEAFEDLLTEDNHGITTKTISRQYFSDATRGFNESLARSNRFCDLRDCGEESLQEAAGQEKVSFSRFMERLGTRSCSRPEEGEVLKEGEPAVDLGMDGGPVLGGVGEEIDKGNGGKATSGPKKTLKKLRTDIR